MRSQPPFLKALLLLLVLLAPSAARAQFVWTGGGANRNWTNGSNWFGGSSPSPGGTALIAGGVGALDFNLDSSQSIGGIQVFPYSYYYGYYNYGYHYPDYHFTSSGPVTLNIGAGGISTEAANLHLDPSIAVNLTAAQTWYVGDDYYDPVVINGSLTNNGFTLTKTGYGTLELHGTNNLTGSVVLNYGTLSLGNGSALGSATLVANGFGVLEGPVGSPFTFANPIDLQNELHINTLRGPVTLSGPINANFASTAILGAYGRNGLTVSGDIALNTSIEFEPDPGSSITLTGNITGSAAKTIYLYSGGTLNMNGSVAPGAVSQYIVYDSKLIFGNAASVPGTTNSIGSVIGYTYSYAGLGAPGVTATTFLGAFNKAIPTATIGFDNGITIADPVDLTGFLATTQLGSATNATLSSSATITPQGSSYNFGGGGGTLNVASNLTGTNSVLASTIAYGEPLTLVLSGANTYTGGTTVDNTALIFANASAFPATGTVSIPAYSYPTFFGRGYVGFGYALDLSTPGASTAVASRFSVAPGAQLVIGYDSPGAGIISSAIDLSGFPTNTALGTATSLTVSGPIVPAGSGSGYAFAAIKDGHLTIATNLSGANGMNIGHAGNDYFPYPDSYAIEDYYNSDYQRGLDNGYMNLDDAKGTVTLTGNNSDLGGTVHLNSGRLEVGNSNALGSGTLQVDYDGILAASSPGVNLMNPLALYGALGLDSSMNSFTLGGDVSGGSLVKLGSGNVTLNGAVSLYNYLRVQEGSLDLYTANPDLESVYVNELGTLNLHGTSATAYDFNGDPGAVLNLDPVTTFTVSGEGYYGGTIAGGGSIVVNGGPFEFAAANSYTGGTTIQSGALIARAQGSLGAGTVTVNGGEFYIGRGVTFTNSLVFTSGVIGGIGTYSPSSGAITIGAGQSVAPSILSSYYYGGSEFGTLAFTSGLTLASGGTYLWGIADTNAAAGGGWSLLEISGALAITATAGSPFTIEISPGNYYYGDYYDIANFNPAQSYSWVIARASGGIAGLTPSNVVLDTTAFSSLFTDHPYASFSLSQNGNDLILNFTPVPEPSTWALLLTGAAAVAFVRRRRS